MMLRSAPNIYFSRRGSFRIPLMWRWVFGRKVVMFEQYHSICVAPAKQWRTEMRRKPADMPDWIWREASRSHKEARVGPQGHVTIPPTLIHLAPVGNRIWLVGHGRTFEICPPWVKPGDFLKMPKRGTRRRPPSQTHAA